MAISFLADAESYQRLQAIAAHFNTDIQPLPANDWDVVEEEVKKVIKSSRAGKSTEMMQMDGPAA